MEPLLGFRIPEVLFFQGFQAFRLVRHGVHAADHPLQLADDAFQFIADHLRMFRLGKDDDDHGFRIHPFAAGLVVLRKSADDHALGRQLQGPGLEQEGSLQSGPGRIARFQNFFPVQSRDGLAGFLRIRRSPVRIFFLVKRLFSLPFHAQFPQAEIVRGLHFQFNAGVFQHVAVVFSAPQINGGLLVFNRFQAHFHGLSGGQSVPVRPCQLHFLRILPQKNGGNDHLAAVHAQGLSLGRGGESQRLGGGNLQRQRGAFRRGNDPGPHRFPSVRAVHVFRIGHRGRGGKQGRARLRHDAHAAHDVPR